MTTHSIYNTEDYQHILERIGALTPDTQPRWGKMSVGQMLSHCNAIQEVMNGAKGLKGTPFIARLFKGMIRNAVVNDKPFKQGLQTHPQYRQTSPKDFETEKSRLLSSLKTFVEMNEADAATLEHPLFGRMTREERGWSTYKHLDHHLQQFGV